MLKRTLLFCPILAFAVACGDSGSTPDATVKVDTGGVTDTGVVTDGGVTDTGSTDTGPTDTGPGPDTGPADTGVVCIDDTIAGTINMPADLLTVADGNTTMTICPNVNDYFSVTLAANDLVVISMNIATAADLDMVLYNGTVDGANEVASAASTNQVEVLTYTAETAGTYILEVLGFDGASSDYTLSIERRTGCTFDADCTTAGESCIMSVLNNSLIRSCETWATPACGQGAEDTPEIYSDSNAAARGTIADGSLCDTDIDVVSIDVTARQTLRGSFASTVPAGGVAAAVLVNPDGTIRGTTVLDDMTATGNVLEAYLPDAGTYYVYILSNATGGGDFTYNLDLTAEDPCFVDGDCTNSTCGTAGLGIGLLGVCTTPPATDGCGNANANATQTAATDLASGVAVTGSACVGSPRYYAIDLVAGQQLTGALTWTSMDDLDVYLIGPDGAALGAGWYGTGSETVNATGLEPGRYYLVVDAFSPPMGGAPTVAAPFSLTATWQAGTCTADVNCQPGGVFDDGQNVDPRAQLTCNTGVCEWPAPQAQWTVGGGNACRQQAGAGVPGDCSTDAGCVFGVCIALCPDGQTDCDAAFTGGTVQAVCNTTDFNGTNVCLPNCGTAIWGDTQCQQIYGPMSMCSAQTNQCMP